MHERPVDQPELSFILPVYDPPIDVLAATLASVSSQTASDWECVVVDDASPTEEVRSELERWATRDARFRIVPRHSNGGIAEATNTGLDAASGRLVAFIDHDDIVLPGAARAVIDHFATHPTCDFVYSDEQLIDSAGNVVADYGKPDYSPVRHLGQHYLCHLIAIRRAAIGDIRVRREFEPAQDFDFALRVIESVTEAGHGVGHLPESLYQWRSIAGSIALDTGEKRGTEEAVLRCVADAIARRGLDATPVPVVHDGAPVTAVRLDLQQPDESDVAVVDLRSASAPDVAELIATTQRPFVHLADGTADMAVARAVAAELRRPDVAIAGPCIVDAEGRLLSAGRLLSPTLHDAFAGDQPAPGPWGSFFVAREVSAVAPLGAVIDVAAARDAGGLCDDVAIDAGLAELSERLRRNGKSTVWTPARVVVAAAEPRLPLRIEPSDVSDDWSVCRQRLGEVRERYDTVGIGHHKDPVLPPILRARDLIATGAVDLVTSDVFDTIVARPVATPSDVFVTLGRELCERGDLAGVTPRQFAQARISAERRARQSVLDRAHGDPRAPECTLDEIWAEMPQSWFDDAGRVLEHELDLEARTLRPIVPALAALQRARDAGIGVVLVSDTYLGADRLRRVLEGCGVDTAMFARIVTSSDHGMGKADGLLEMAISEFGAEPSRTLHLGDNPDADIATAQRIGATAVQVDVPLERRHVGRASSRSIVEYSRVHGTDGGVTSATRAQLNAAGGLGHHPSYQFGALAAGPALAGFARWVASTASRLGATSVHYLLREGATIADLVDVVADDPIPRRLVHASRWVDMRAAVVDGTAAELHEALARRGPTTVQHVAAAFGLEPGHVRAIWNGADAHDPTTLRAGCALLVDDDSTRASILRAAAELRGRVIRQLVREVDPDALAGRVPLVVVDVGWGATIQSGIARILRAEGHDVDLVGLYFALSAPGEARAADGMAVHSYLPSDFDDPGLARASREISHHADTVERLLMPSTGTLLDIDEDGDPSLSTNLEPQPGSLLIAKRGVHEIALMLREQGFDDDVWVDDVGFRGALASTLAVAITQPSPELATQLLSWPHDDVAGADPQPVGGTVSSQLLPYVTIRELPMLRQSERAWLEGAAAVVNPLLAAQIAAERAGSDVDRLAPGAPTGPSRLAAFPIGSDLADLQIEHHLGVAADGWSALRLSGSHSTLRSVRFDAGTEAALVEIRRFSVGVERRDGRTSERSVDDLEAADLDWVNAWPTGASRYVAAPGGHVIVPIDAQDGASPGRLDVVVVFRRWSLRDDDPLLRPGLRWQATKVSRRLKRAASRRLR